MTKVRGIVLAGGLGTRLGELTKVTNKHLLPVGPWPMVYYPIKKLVGAGIREIMLISGTDHMGDFIELLGSGRHLGAELTYRVQDEPGGIAQALQLTRRFGEGADKIVVLLGDNIFYDPLGPVIQCAHCDVPCAEVVLKEVSHPERFGVAEFDPADSSKISKITEKPANPATKMAVTGIYVYPTDIYTQILPSLKPSARGELEITDVNNDYILAGRLRYSVLSDYWTDAGSPDTYHLANQLVAQKVPVF